MNIAEYLRPLEMNVFAVNAEDRYSALARLIEARAKQKMHIPPIGSQLPTIIKTDRSGTDDRDFAEA